MKQQQFEKLLFGDGKLSSSEKGQMASFVLDNPNAALLQNHWNSVKAQLDKAEVQVPEIGFVQRWRELQVADDRRKVQIQAFWVILFSAIAAGFMAYLTIGSEQSFLHYAKDFFISTTNQLLEISSFIQIVFRMAVSILQKFPPSWWASVASALVLLPMLWLVVYRELISVKGVAQ